MTSEGSAETRNIIRGGVFLGPVVQGRDIQATFQLPAPAPVALAQLPTPVAGFTGRDDELAVLARLLDPAGTAGPVVVSAVAGLAGVGKTTLAVEAGHAAVKRGWFGGGVLFINLHGYDEPPVEPDQALDALLRALGVAAEHIPPTAEERAGLYRSVLAETGEPVLVIADNASTEAQVKPLLPGTGPHKVLVTSRHTLAGLDARLVDVTVLDKVSAIELLDAALRAARPSDDRISADPEAAVRLATVCGGLPLALQITGALLKADLTLGAGDLAEQLTAESARLEQLAYDDGSGSSAPSVAAAFDLSYRRLDKTSARVFRSLPVSPGPDVSADSAAVLADLPVPEVRTVLAALARAHLAEPALGSPGRWRIHDLVRLYVRQLSEENADSDGREQAIDRLLAYYVKMAGAADGQLRLLPANKVPAEFAGQREALAWLDAERATLVAAVRLAADTGRDWDALRLPALLAEYFYWRHRFDDWIACAKISVNAAGRVGDRRHEGAALTALGLALVQARRFGEAITACQAAAAIYRETGDRHGGGLALNNLGLALRRVGRVEEAITAHQAAAAIYRETDDRQGEGSALNNLGIALSEVGRIKEAITACQQAAAMFRETGDHHSEGSALNSLGVALRQVGRVEEAIAAHQAAAAIFGETGDRHREGSALTNLGIALSEVGRVEEAITACQQAATLFRETGDHHGEGLALGSLGVAMRQVGRVEEAITAWQEAAAIFRETGDHQHEEMALRDLERARTEQQG